MNFTALTGSVDSILKKKKGSFDDDKSFELSGEYEWRRWWYEWRRWREKLLLNRVYGFFEWWWRGVVDIVDDDEEADIVIPTWKELQGFKKSVGC